MSFAAITTGAIALFLLGLFSLAVAAAADYAKTLPNVFDMRVSLNEPIPQKQIQETVLKIRGMSGVAEVVLIPRERAWEKMRAEQPELTTGIENPLPDQLRVRVRELKDGDRIARQIQDLPTVIPDEGVRYLRQEQRTAVALINAFKLLGLALFAVLSLAAAVLIYNTVRLTVISRRLEIRIMQLVGASQFAIRVPFLIEGVMQGTGAGIAASLLLYGSIRLLGDQVGIHIVSPDFPVWSAVALMVATGAVYGFTCSVFAVRAPLRYR